MSFVLGYAHAQDCHLVIKGKVIDQHNGKPLKGAIIAIYGLEKEVFSKPSYTFTQYQAPRTVPPEDLIDGSEIITPESPIFDFKDAPDGYFLLDLSWNFQWKDVQAGFIIKNITNTAYRDYLNEMRLFADEPGRNFLLTLNYTIN